MIYDPLIQPYTFSDFADVTVADLRAILSQE
jgi:hypothetical protein